MPVIEITRKKLTKSRSATPPTAKHKYRSASRQFSEWLHP
jgi:hypothetical protein